MNFDTTVILFVKDVLRVWPVYDALVLFAAFFLIWIMVVIIFFLTVDSCMNWKQCRLIFWGILGAATIGGLSNFLFSHFFYYRVRPYILFEYVPLIDSRFMSGSFPSTHATIAFALAVSWMVYAKRFSGLLLTIALTIAIARVFAGVHYPTDVFAGAAWGSLVGAVFMFYYKKNIRV